MKTLRFSNFPLILCGWFMATPLVLADSGGPLDPLGPPGPTMKTLEQIEPRTIVQCLPGDAANLYIIREPGSYYLTNNITGVAGKNGILIDADCVTLDLSGFKLRGVVGSLDGIVIHRTHHVVIRDGCICGWDGDGVDGTQGAAWMEGLRVSDNGGRGIVVNTGSQFKRCLVASNGAVGIETSNDVQVYDCYSSSNVLGGISVGTGSIVKGCLAYYNGGTGITGWGGTVTVLDSNSDTNGFVGIEVAANSLVRNCQARQNGSHGISADPGSTLSECTASLNTEVGLRAGAGSTVQGCSVRQNGDDGIRAGEKSTVTRCTASNNRGDGIEVDTDCLVTENTCGLNGAGASAAGIHAIRAHNRIEANHVTHNDQGLLIDGVESRIANNTVYGNTDNYDIAPGNQLEILLCEIPESIDWPATVKLAGTLEGTAGRHGITITTNDVTIDLCGHALVGVAGSLDGVHVSSPTNATLHNIAVRNGTLRQWRGDGVDLSLADNCQLSQLRAFGNNPGYGLRVGTGGLVTGCTLEANVVGVSVGRGSTVKDCTVLANINYGILGGDASVIKDNTVSSTVVSNNAAGIQVTNHCQVVGNTCDGNSYGIRARGSCNRIEANLASGSRFWGISVTLTNGHNVVVKNNACNNAEPQIGEHNYQVARGNFVGPIISLATGPDPYLAPVHPQNHAWANFGDPENLQ
jgi:hypothetical protein